MINAKTNKSINKNLSYVFAKVLPWVIRLFLPSNVALFFFLTLLPNNDLTVFQKKIAGSAATYLS